VENNYALFAINGKAAQNQWRMLKTNEVYNNANYQPLVEFEKAHGLPMNRYIADQDSEPNFMYAGS